MTKMTTELGLGAYFSWVGCGVGDGSGEGPLGVNDGGGRDDATAAIDSRLVMSNSASNSCLCNVMSSVWARCCCSE